VQAIFPKIQAFVDDFHAGKAAGQNENSSANKPVVKVHNASAPAATKKTEATQPSPAASQPSKKSPASSTAAGIKRGSNRIDFKETFYCCALSMTLACLALQLLEYL
jgi:hypothetical protein